MSDDLKNDVQAPIDPSASLQPLVRKDLNLAVPFLSAVLSALDSDRTNFVRCIVGDLGVEYEDDIRAAMGLPNAPGEPLPPERDSQRH